MNPNDMLGTHFPRLSKYNQDALKKLRITTVSDLLYHFPSRYASVTNAISHVNELGKGAHATLSGTLTNLKTSKGFRTKIPMAEGTFTDATGKIKVVWFNQPYLAKMTPNGSMVTLSGKVSERKGALYLSNPSIEKSIGIVAPDSLFRNDAKNPDATLTPVYPESRGVTSLWFFHAIARVLSSGITDTLEDPIPKEILTRYNLPVLGTALIWAHRPRTHKEARAARKRFAFEEIFLIQLKNQQNRRAYEAQPSWEINPDKKILSAFTKRFPFSPTGAQTRAVESILTDMRTPHAMSRLLEGDVGSGKTFVAAATAHAVVSTRPAKQDFGTLQVAYMAPTEILAKQLFESFIEFFKGLPIHIALITGSGCRKFPSKTNPNEWTTISRAQLLKWVVNGEIAILVGTHALIQKSVTFKHLAYVIIDEQHRFGTNQRSTLARKNADKELPHLLSMTATPIPRTLALTVYGDLDLTLLDEMPAGRKMVQTDIVQNTLAQEKMYAHMRKLLAEGRQAYVITPRIDEPDESNANSLRTKSAIAEAKRLQREVFPKNTVDVMHGKMTPKEKDAAMEKFANGDTDVLVATSVVEVGVNVPNATVMVIEGAERFGLAQLHQLRGRVMRSTHQAYCYLVPSKESKASLKRLAALTRATNGFELAEEDLKQRGAGELYGRKQWGISDVGMEALQNIKMVEAARHEAQKLITKDPELTAHPMLAREVGRRGDVHFE